MTVSSNFAFYDNDIGHRFRNVINSLNSHINVGVFSNVTLSGFLKESKSQICAFANTHFSKEALKVIHNQVIERYI